MTMLDIMTESDFDYVSIVPRPFSLAMKKGDKDIPDNRSCITVAAFPHPFMILWSDAGLQAGVLMSNKHWNEKKEGCEVVLPYLWRMLQNICDNQICHTPTCVATFKGPGPYTRLRSGRAFASGMALGWNVPCAEKIFFDLYADNIRCMTAVHTGIDQWIVDQGAPMTQRPPSHWNIIESDLYNEQDTIHLAERLCLASMRSISV